MGSERDQIIVDKFHIIKDKHMVKLSEFHLYMLGTLEILHALYYFINMINLIFSNYGLLKWLM